MNVWSMHTARMGELSSGQLQLGVGFTATHWAYSSTVGLKRNLAQWTLTVEGVIKVL